MAQDDAEYVRQSPPAVGHEKRRPAAEVHLHFVARLALHAADWQLRAPAQPADEAAHAVVAAREAVLDDQVLVNPLRRQVPFPGRDDHRAVRFALAESTRGPERPDGRGRGIGLAL